MSVKARLKRILPIRAQYLYARLRGQRIQRQYRSLGLADAFTRIYKAGAWGPAAADGTPNSGWGSHGEYLAQWCSLVDTQLREHGVTSVADLGCGNLAAGIAVACMGYDLVGVDIAQPLADWSVHLRSNARITFVYADLTTDPLPTADAGIVRQVLQHLTNSEVEAALANVLRTYPLVFITEHVYTGPGCVPNVDMPHGPGTRVPMLSGVFIDRPPFNVPAKSVGDIYVAPREALRTWVVENHSPLSREPANDGGRTRHSQALQP